MKNLMRFMIIMLFPMAVMGQTSSFYQSVKVHRCQISSVMAAVSSPAIMIAYTV